MERYRELSNAVLENLVEQNDISAIAELADRYENGTNEIEQDYKKSAELYLKAAELGDSIAQNQIANYYELGRGVEKNEKEAFKWFEKSAHNGNTWGCLRLGSLYTGGKVVDKDENAGFYWIRKALLLGNTYANYKLGLFYEDGIGTIKSRERAINCYKDVPKDAPKYINACKRILNLYKYNDDDFLEDNPEEVFKYIKELAELNDKNAIINLANRYLLGKGCEIDIYLCHKWIDKSAALSLDSLPYVVANKNLFGHSNLKVGSYKQAVEGFLISLKWLNKMKEHKIDDPELYNTEAFIEYELGQAYYKLGEKEEAREHFAKATKLGELKANVYLADLSSTEAEANGVHLSKLTHIIPMLNSAVQYLNNHGNLNDEDDKYTLEFAYNQLFLAYLEGTGTQVNDNAAYDYCKRSADLGNEFAIGMLPKFKSKGNGYEFVGE